MEECYIESYVYRKNYLKAIQTYFGLLTCVAIAFWWTPPLIFLFSQLNGFNYVASNTELIHSPRYCHAYYKTWCDFGLQLCHSPKKSFILTTCDYKQLTGRDCAGILKARDRFEREVHQGIWLPSSKAYAHVWVFHFQHIF